MMRQDGLRTRNAALMGALLISVIAPASSGAPFDALEFPSSASAGAVNPANWTFFVETTGNDATWTSPAGQNVTTGFPFYAVASEITQLDIDVDTPIIGTQTLDKDDLIGLGVITADQLIGSDTLPGPLPITITDQTFDEPGILAADVIVSVDANGHGFASITNVNFGSLPLLGPIVAVRIGGDVTDEGVVPEPTIIFLFPVAGL
jgi:hypothetical protein